jgi:pSer/pThr/pTyr-binding forkhead associated (FHA) protein
MALLEMGGRRFAIAVGEIVLGGDASCTISLQGQGALPRHAVVQGRPDGQVVIRKAVPQAEVRINGVRLGAEPTPLLHGDKVELGGHELTFVDERRSGSTQSIQAMKLPEAGPVLAKADLREGQPTASTGGRVVCLTDGREYQIAGTSLVFGRDATCDVVVPGKDVSRRHCEIIQTPKGYLVVDSSTNGTFVNEQRVEGQRVLGRADVVRIGDEQFRFYADPAPAPARPSPGAAVSEPPAAPPVPRSAPAGAGERLKDTVHGVPGVGRSPGGPLATFLVKAGALKGRRLTVRTPVVNVGRADYNDLVLPDESVSTAHAKLQRREGVWVLVDLDSTNGTFVDGERVKGEAPLSPGVVVRFGDVQLVFDPSDDALAVVMGGGTHVIQAFQPVPPGPPASSPAGGRVGGQAGADSVAKPPAHPPARPPAKDAPTRPPAKGGAAAPAKRPAAQAPEPKKGTGCGSGAAVIALGMAGLIFWMLV